MKPKKRPPKPAWLKKRLSAGPVYRHIRKLIKGHRLNTVCQEAKCPNLWECFSRKTATFLIMGPGCSRDCRFCAVTRQPLRPPDPEEPTRIAEIVQRLDLRYAVITSVTRDDLADGGAEFFVQTILAIRAQTPSVRIEVLIPDFKGDTGALEQVMNAYPDVLSHNLETVLRLYPAVRPEAVYRRSLDILRQVKMIDDRVPTKSGLMLGLGEAQEEIVQSLRDLRSSACDILTLGQYLQPTRNHLPVKRYLTPEEFNRLKQTALQMGFAGVASEPFVRSSYQAEKLYRASISQTGNFS